MAAEPCAAEPRASEPHAAASEPHAADSEPHAAAAEPRVSWQESSYNGHPTDSYSSTTQPPPNNNSSGSSGSSQSRTKTRSSHCTQNIQYPPEIRNSLNLDHQQCIAEMDSNRDRFMTESFDVMGPLVDVVRLFLKSFKHGVALIFSFLFSVVAAIFSKAISSYSSILVTLVVIFILYRQRQLVSGRIAPTKILRGWRQSSTPHYALIVCGSGGHTSEMLKMIKQSIRPEANSHRRWVLGTDDRLSFDKVLKFEQDLGDRFGQQGLPCGTFDVMSFRRGRAVHQSWFTTPWTVFLNIVHILRILISVPSTRRVHGFQFPGVIVTDGPGSGFLFLLVAHFLKLFYIAPEKYMNTIFIESWARASSLSLSGKLIWLFHLADVFVVQHQELAARYKQTYTKNMVVMPTKPPVPMQ
ncbi:oligosaccharide biosynthesis protein Alg14 like-domain-containing protein [Whalleya microplaca]|nr:oligosaccharide biosynthesis protein Alg14 like-domain-containing protein [Whalleya microplaca]